MLEEGDVIVLNKRILIVGAGSFSTEIEEMARLVGYDDFAFLDDKPDEALSHPVIGSMNEIHRFRNDFDYAIVALGNNVSRLKYHNILKDCGYSIPVLIHPQAYVSPDAVIAQGCIVRPFAVVGRYAQLGETVILNIGAKVDHHCVIGKGSHLLINSVVRGSSMVEPLSWVDAGEIIQ